MGPKGSVSQFAGGMFGGVLGMALFIWAGGLEWMIAVGGFIGFALGYYLREFVVGVINIPAQARSVMCMFRRRNMPAYICSEAQQERAKTAVVFLTVFSIMIMVLLVFTAPLTLLMSYPNQTERLAGLFYLGTFLFVALSALSCLPDDFQQTTYWSRMIKRLSRYGVWCFLVFVVVSYIRGMLRSIICVIPSVAIIAVLAIVEWLASVIAVVLLLIRMAVFLMGPRGHWLGISVTIATTCIIVSQGKTFLLDPELARWAIFGFSLLNGLICGGVWH